MDDRLRIKELAEEDRPREKMRLKGAAALSDAELIAILIGSGSSTETAVQLSQRILGTVDNSLGRLARLTVDELMAFRGIGEAKAITIAAAMELGGARGSPTTTRTATRSAAAPKPFASSIRTSATCRTRNSGRPSPIAAPR